MILTPLLCLALTFPAPLDSGAVAASAPSSAQPPSALPEPALPESQSPSSAMPSSRQPSSRTPTLVETSAAPAPQGAANPCEETGLPVAQGRHLVRRGDKVLLCLRDAPLALLSGVFQMEVAPLDDDPYPDLLVNWSPRSGAHRRLHVYGLETGTLPPVWRGSGMSSSLHGFALVPFPGKPSTLVTLESVGKKRRFVGHRWNKFGFVGICSAAVDPSGAGQLVGCQGTSLSCWIDSEGWPQCKVGK